MAKRKPFYCSFCGKMDHEVIHMVAGPQVFICDECVACAQSIIDAKLAHQAPVVEHEPENVVPLVKLVR